MFLANRKKTPTKSSGMEPAMPGTRAPSNMASSTQNSSLAAASSSTTSSSSAAASSSSNDNAKADGTKKKPWRWQNSWAKEILREAIAQGDISPEHTYDEIHVWHPEVQETSRNKLPGRVRSLRAQVSKDDAAATSDAIALAHDRKLYPIPTHNYRGEPRWQGSPAETYLKKDISAAVHKTMTPFEFCSSRPEYKDYCSDVIREHAHQEVKFQKYCAFRNDKKALQFIKFSKWKTCFHKNVSFINWAIFLSRNVSNETDNCRKLLIRDWVIGQNFCTKNARA